MWLRQKSEGSHGLGFAAPARVSNSKQALNQSRSYDPETNSKPTKLSRQTNESLLNNLTILKPVHPPEDQPVISSQNPPQHAAYGGCGTVGFRVTFWHGLIRTVNLCGLVWLSQSQRDARLALAASQLRPQLDLGSGHG